MKIISRIFSIFSLKVKHFVVTFQFSILSVFISLFVFSTAALILITSYRFSTTISYTAFNLMEKTSNALSEKISSGIQRATALNELSANLIKNNVIDPKDLPRIMDYTFYLLDQETKTYPSSNIEGVAWSDAQGNYVWSQRQNDNTVMSEISDTVHGSKRVTYYYRDKDGKIIKTMDSKKESDLSYDARLRPWYSDALKFGKTSVTEVGQYYDSNLFGMSIFTPVFDNKRRPQGIFEIDIELLFLKKFIEDLKVSQNGLVFILNEKSEVISFPHRVTYQGSSLLNIHSLPYPWVIQSFKEYNRTGKETFSFESGNKTYLAAYKRIPRPSTTNDLIVGVVAPKDDFLGDLYKMNLFTLFVSFFIFLLGIFLISYLVSKIVQPLKKLTGEIAKVKNFNLEGDSRVESNISEVISISENVQAMKLGLRSFQKYIPAPLVRQLIELGEDVRIGGVKKPLVVFFSDIVNFTSSAEKEDPEKVTQHLCEYFSELSPIIVEEKGTIDKYIGDSIMAFWGAPVAQEFASMLAARAALRCKQRLTQLNEKWKQEQKPAFVTRIGIHMGNAIVGNIGSADRINYTVVGDVVNHASRLEGVNRQYGTQIIVSSDVYQELKTKFVFRHLDRVRLKGRMEVEEIYELMAESRSGIPFDLDLYTENFEAGFSAYSHKKWSEAVGFFKKCISIYPEDTVAPVFIARCERFQLNPPVADWDGVWDA